MMCSKKKEDQPEKGTPEDEPLSSPWQKAVRCAQLRLMNSIDDGFPRFAWHVDGFAIDHQAEWRL